MPGPSARRISPRGYRIGAILALIAFVPLMGAAWYATTDVVEARRERNRVERVEADVADLVLMSELRARLFDERNWTSAADGITGIELTPEFVAAITGIDIPAELADASSEVDRLIGELALSNLAIQLTEVRSTEDVSLTQRGYLFDALEDDVELMATQLIERIVAASAEARDEGALIDDLRALESATIARSAIAAEFNAFFSAQFSTDVVQTDEIVALIGFRSVREGEFRQLVRTSRSGSATEAVLAEIAASDMAVEFDAAVGGLTETAIAGQVAAAPEGSIPVDIVGAARVFEASSVTSNLYLDLVRAAGEDVTEAARSAASEAERRNRQAFWSLIVLTTASMLLAIASARAIARPIRDLAEAARRLRDGDDHDVRAAPRGPTEVQEATRAINEATDQLALAEQQALALAEGDLEHRSLSEHGTGSLGASLQSAVRTLASSLQEREELRERMTHEATHDGLTQLANRNASLGQIEAGLERANLTDGHVAVLFIDLDGFKNVNDQFGHRAGDFVLREIAQRLGSSARPGDHIGRLGGDEFLLIAESIADESEAVELARRAFATIVTPIRFDDVEVSIGCCIGIALSDGGISDPTALLQDADLAVYRAKELGRNRIEVCDDELRAIMSDRADIEQSLRSAIDNDELELWYQPVVTERSGFDPAGFEALVRWRRPGYGMVQPDTFIPVAERTDLILAVDRWVVRRVVEQMTEWDRRRDVPRVPISINVSGRHLASPDFVATIVGPIIEAGIDPDRLIIEVTESALLDDIETAADKLERVREYGVRVAIDDFGTGYTSLAHLRNLPIDILKIDKSFTNDDEAMSLVQLIIDSGHLLGASVTAEGIETREQAARILAMGADSLQGYFYGRPVPPLELGTQADRAEPADAIG